MKVVETGLWLSGFLLLALFFGAHSWADAARERGIADFIAHKQGQLIADDTVPMPRGHNSRVRVARSVAAVTLAADAGLLTPAPSAAPAAFAPVHAGTVIAVLRIPRIDLQVPVGMGTDEAVLMRGAGHIEGTAAPGSAGNVAIAAHRDSFFRGLKDVVVGDLIELESAHRVDAYRITRLSVVAPSNVQVLADTGSPVLTLVTCFPFYFVGHAPQRFIVSAVPAEFHAQASRRSP